MRLKMVSVCGNDDQPGRPAGATCTNQAICFRVPSFQVGRTDGQTIMINDVIRWLGAWQSEYVPARPAAMQIPFCPRVPADRVIWGR